MVGRRKHERPPVAVVIGLWVLFGAGFAQPVRAEGANRPVAVPADNASRNVASVEQEEIRFAKDQATAGAGKSWSDLGGTSGSTWWALSLVLLLICGAAVVLRRAYPGARGLGSLPQVQVLGRTSISPKQSLAMVKVDRRLILLGVTENMVSNLLTITDQEEVSRIVAEIARRRTAGVAGGFRNLFTHEQEEYEGAGPELPPLVGEGGGEPPGGSELDALRSEVSMLRDKIQRFRGEGG